MKCLKCNKSKVSRYALYGQLRVILLPDRAWKIVAFDFIIKLLLLKEPLTRVEYDFI
jgi:hypothetical protein